MLSLNSSSSNHTIFNKGNIGPCTIVGLCCLVGICGNMGVVMVIARKFRRGDKNFTLKLVLNLAMADLLSLVTLPVWIHSWLFGWVLGVKACRFFSFLVIGSLYCSVLTVTLMSVQRYLAVLYTRQWMKLRGAGERILLASLWGLSGVLACPALVLGDVVGEEMRCRWKYSSVGEKVFTKSMETLWGFIVPFTILVTSYGCLHHKVNDTAFFSSPRLTKLVTSIVVTFFVLWCPLHVVNIMGICGLLLKSEYLNNICETGWAVTQALTFINSCVNPFLYAFAFRKRNKKTEQSTQSTQSKITQFT
nr:leukotriene B4 receptor 1-like [Paramormyrops kingsleyae]